MNKIAQLYDRWLKAEHLRGPVVARVTMAREGAIRRQEWQGIKVLFAFSAETIKAIDPQ